MSEVKRYRAADGLPGMWPDKNGGYVAIQDFDRVTAGRDAALESIARLNEKISCMSAHVLAYKLSRQRLLGRARARELLISELQLRLTTADERADRLEAEKQAMIKTHVLYTWLRKKCDQPSNDVVAVHMNIGHDWVAVYDLDTDLRAMIEREEP